MLVEAGVGTVLGELARNAGVSYLVLGFGVAMLLRIAQGSATVAMITVSSILAPLVVESPPAYNAVYILMAIGGGSITGGWMNDSGFWVYRTMTGLTEIEALKTKTVSLAALGLTGLLARLDRLHPVPARLVRSDQRNGGSEESPAAQDGRGTQEARQPYPASAEP